MLWLINVAAVCGGIVATTAISAIAAMPQPKQTVSQITQQPSSNLNRAKLLEPLEELPAFNLDNLLDSNAQTAGFKQAEPLPIEVTSVSESLPELFPQSTIKKRLAPSHHATLLQAQNVTPPPENIEVPEPNPNQDRFLGPTPTPEPLPPDTDQPVQPPRQPDQPISPEIPPIEVRQIEVIGSTIFSPEEFNPIIEPLEGRTVTVEQLREAADRITQLYLERGYITSRAILADQDITDGVVQILVIEGSLEEIQIEGTQRVNTNYIRSRVELGTQTPLNTAQLEDQLRLLRIDPLFENVEASLRSGTEIGKSILVVRVEEANPFFASVSVDNYSPPSIGSERVSASIGYLNLTGNGDQIVGSYRRSISGGSNIFDFSYRYPLNAMNGTLSLRALIDRNEVTQEPFDELDIEGETELYEISYRQPLIRTPREEFALSIGFSYRDGQTFFAGEGTPFGIGPNEEGITRTSVIKFEQDYLRRDPRGAWSLRSLFNFGVGLFDATVNDSPEPDSLFFSWLGQIQRVQVLNENNFLIIGADIQLTPDTLLSSQQFVIGGGQSLRGYRQNIRSGDNGVLFSIEDRITLDRNEAGASTLQIAPFFNAGVTWNNPDNPNPQPDQRFLAALGLGVIWQPLPGLTLRVDYAPPLIDLDDRGDNLQDDGFYFSIGYQL